VYAALYRHLPGPWPVRVLVLLALAALVVWACFTWVFPYVASVLPINDPTVGAAAPPSAHTTGTALRPGGYA